MSFPNFVMLALTLPFVMVAPPPVSEIVIDGVGDWEGGI